MVCLMMHFYYFFILFLNLVSTIQVIHSVWSIGHTLYFKFSYKKMSGLHCCICGKINTNFGLLISASMQYQNY